MKNKRFAFALIATFLIGALLTSCEKEKEKIWGEVVTFFTIQNVDNLSAPTTIRVINATKNAESYHWSFPGGFIVINGQPTEENTFTGIQPEGVFYPVPGNYVATLKIMADGKETSHTINFTVAKPTPVIMQDPTGLVYGDLVTFWVEFFKYPGLSDQVTYSWNLGNGVTSTVARPQTTYNLPGTYTVTLQLFDGVEILNVSRQVIVQAEIAKTLFITNAIDQSLYKMMLYSGAIAPLEQLPINVGLHPLSVSVFQNRLIVSVAGDHIRFAPAETPPDGFIFTTNLAGGNRYTITQPSVMEHNYVADPFISTVGPDGTVYWLNRFQGVRKIDHREVNGEYPAPFVWDVPAVMATHLGVPSTFGWTDGGVRIVNNEIWYSKHGTGRGLYRFAMDGNFIARIEGLFQIQIRCFEVDTQNNQIYFAVNRASGGLASAGLYVSNIDGTNIRLIDPLDNFSMQGGEGERTYVTSIVVDAEGGYIYYPFRHQSDINTAGQIVGNGSLSGVRRWKMDGSKPPEFLVTGIVPFGIGIDHVKR